MTNNHKDKIGSLIGLKAIALLCLFWWHSPMPKPFVDLGARTCEFLFIVSGFLVAYNYADRNIPCTWEESLRFSFRKLAKFWPLHLIATIIFLLTKGGIYTAWDVLRLGINLGLFQTWSPYATEYFGFNGLSWFLADLIFCYFMVPFLLKFAKTKKVSLIMFCACFFVRAVIEYTTVKCSGYFWDISTHANPVVRCLEFAMGMFCYPLFIYLKEKLPKYRKERLLFSIGEAIGIALMIFLLISKNNSWYKFEYILCFCPFFLLFAFDKGVCSKFLSTKPFVWFSSIQFEFFLLHIVIIYFVEDIISNWVISSTVIFALVLLAAYVYHRFLNDTLESIMKKIYNKVFNYLGLNVQI